MKTLVLCLGNDILTDDAAGLLAARELRKRVGDSAEVRESSESGFALLDLMTGFERMLIIDSIRTGAYPPGTILEFHAEDLGEVAAPSPHYAGLPELIALARRLDLLFPTEIAILALEVKDPFTIGEGLTGDVESALEALVERAMGKLRCWLEESTPSPPTHTAPP